MQPTISAHEDGLELVDPTERRRLVMETGGDVDPEPVSPESLGYPVDVAVRFDAEWVSLPKTVEAFVRGPSGEIVATVATSPYAALEAGDYTIEFNASMKVYLSVDGPLHLAAADGVRVAFEAPREVIVGVRSYHQHPSTTVTTTADPADVLDAVSVLGSALKTTSPERSYPTLRGHPPLLERGDELDVPADLSRPDVGVRLAVPETLRGAFVVAPLAYYLGADVVAGDDPRLVTDAGFEYSLDGEGGFERTVERVLKQTFLLDCLVRTEGYTGVPLHEREVLEPRLDLDFSRAYALDMERRLEAYLTVPYDRIADHVPRWGVTAHVAPTPARIECLPFVANRLATVRTSSAQTVSDEELQGYALREYLGGEAAGSGERDVRGASPDGARAREGGGGTSGPIAPRPADRVRPVLRGGADSGDRDRDRAVRVAETDAIEQVWFGDGIPLNASKGLTQAYLNALDRDPRSGAIDITVVCNERGMGEEFDVARTVYGSREDLPFDVTVERDLSTEALAEAFAERADFLHYIGHVDPAGFRCRDGTLDAAALDEVGVDAFFLNACQSYGQGRALVETGAVGGVVTFSDVINSGAVRLGHTMARLLNVGFPLRAALSVARGESFEGGHYLVVGDGTLDVVQDESGIPLLYEIESLGSGEVTVAVRAFLPDEGGMGTLANPFVVPDETYFLAPGVLKRLRISTDRLRAHLGSGTVPVLSDGRLTWGDEIEW